MSNTNIIDINDEAGRLIAADWLAKAESVHRQLRPYLPAEYVDKMLRVFTQGGRMCVAIQSSEVNGVAVYRIHENTADGMMMYVDDLVTNETKRSNGIGKSLLAHLQAIAVKAKCDRFTLDSGTQRPQAH